MVAAGGTGPEDGTLDKLTQPRPADLTVERFVGAFYGGGLLGTQGRTPEPRDNTDGKQKTGGACGW